MQRQSSSIVSLNAVLLLSFLVNKCFHVISILETTGVWLYFLAWCGFFFQITEIIFIIYVFFSNVSFDYSCRYTIGVENGSTCNITVISVECWIGVFTSNSHCDAAFVFARIHFERNTSISSPNPLPNHGIMIASIL